MISVATTLLVLLSTEPTTAQRMLASPAHWFFSGINSHKNNDYKTAIECYTKAIELDSKYTDAYIKRGHARYDQGEIDPAIADMTTAVALDPRILRGSTFLDS